MPCSLAKLNPLVIRFESRKKTKLLPVPNGVVDNPNAFALEKRTPFQ